MQIAVKHQNIRASRIALPITVGLHLLVFFWLVNQNHNAPHTASIPQKTLSLLLLPFQKQEAIAPSVAIAPPKQARVLPPPRPISPITIAQPTNAVTVAPRSPVVTVEAPIPSEKEAPSAVIAPGDLISNAKRDIGKLDRELRKSAPKLLELAPNTAQIRFEKGLAAAGKSVTTTMENITLPDGRLMTKITGPDGSYCAYKESITGGDGIDHFQRGVKTRVTNCPL